MVTWKWTTRRRTQKTQKTSSSFLYKEKYQGKESADPGRSQEDSYKDEEQIAPEKEMKGAKTRTA